MADMLRTLPPLFALPPSPSWLESGPPRTRPSSAEPAPGFGALPRAALESERGQLRRALASGGRRLLLRRFLDELGHVLDQQRAVLSQLDCPTTECFTTLNRQFYAMRSAAELMKLNNLARAAGRAEVLANLLAGSTLTYHTNHAEVLRETHLLLRRLVERVLETDSDESCHPITQTVWSLHAALDPLLCDYEPGEHADHLVAQSTDATQRSN